MRNFDPRCGQSVTLSGRCISRHMASVVNDIICGVKDHRGESIIYGDSVHEETLINTNMGLFTIGQLYDYCENKWEERGKYFGSDDNIKVLSYNPETKLPEYYNINHVIKHWTEKEMFEIRDTRRIEPNIANTNCIEIYLNNISKNISKALSELIHWQGFFVSYLVKRFNLVLLFKLK